MGKTIKEIIYTTLMGKIVPLLQHEKRDGSMTLTGENNPLPVKQITPKTIKTHNLLVVNPLSSSAGAWIDTDGYQVVVISAKAEEDTEKFHFDVEWSDDGVVMDTITQCGSNYAGIKKFPSRALTTRKRWMRVVVYNEDAVNALTLSSSVYLKA